MSLSRKDYEAVAGVIRQEVANAREYHGTGPWNPALDTLDDVAVGLAAYFARDNERFDTHRFLDAAGVR